MLAPCPEEAGEAVAEPHRVVADASPGAVTTRLVSVAIERVWTRGALTELTRRSSVSGITQATHLLVGVPRAGVSTPSLCSKNLLWTARTVIAALVGANCALTSHSFVLNETLTNPRFTVANSLVGALGPWEEVVGVDHTADPCVITGASAEGTIGSNPISTPI